MDTLNNGLPPLPSVPSPVTPGPDAATMPAPVAVVPPAPATQSIPSPLPPMPPMTSAVSLPPMMPTVPVKMVTEVKSEVSRTGIKPVIVIVLVLLALLVGFGIGFRLGGTNTASVPPVTGGPESNQTACPADAMVCPDGTSVGRVGPNCEFAPCPTAAGAATGEPATQDTGTQSAPPAP